MALAPLEVLIYAIVITGQAVPAECSRKPDQTVVCTNGVTAVEGAGHMGMVLNGKVSVQPARDGSLLFSNGITVSRGSAGWIRFSTGIAARKDVSGYRNTFLIAPDLVCTEESETKAVCKKKE